MLLLLHPILRRLRFKRNLITSCLVVMEYLISLLTVKLLIVFGNL